MNQDHHFVDFPSLAWHRRNFWVSFASWLIWVVPTAMFFVGTTWSIIALFVSIGVGLWRAKWDRRIAALIGYGLLGVGFASGCEWFGIAAWAFVFWMTCVKDGFERSAPKPPDEEWN